MNQAGRATKSIGVDRRSRRGLYEVQPHPEAVSNQELNAFYKLSILI